MSVSPELVQAIRVRYRGRPEKAAEVLANAEAWEALKDFAAMPALGEREVKS